MIVIPAIDIIEGQCVRLSEGDYGTKKVYNTNPVEVAMQFEAEGISHLHVVDLDGAKAGKLVNHSILYNICNKTNLKVDFGGGVRTNEDLAKAFDCGANQVTGGSIAVKNADLFGEWIELYGEKIILGADVRDRKVAVSGWLEGSGHDVVDFVARHLAKGLKHVVCTDISKDGMLAGPAVELYHELIAEFNNSNSELKLIASGGVASLQDLKRLKEIGCYGAIVGKAIYEKKITIDDILKI